MRSKRIILFVLFSLALSVMDSSQSQWIIKTSPHFTYYYMEECPQAKEIDYQMSLSENHYEKMTRLLGVSLKGRIKFYYYPSKELFRKMTGNSGTGITNNEKMEVHSIYPYHPHEVVHVMAHVLGDPPAILVEGLAVCYGWDTGWKGKTVEWWTSEFIAQKKFVPLSSLLQSTQFRMLDDQVTYPEAGSFVKYLIEVYGMEKFKTLYSRARDNTIKNLMGDMSGKSIEEMQENWLEYVSRQVSASKANDVFRQAEPLFTDALALFEVGKFPDSKTEFSRSRQLYAISNDIHKSNEAMDRISQIDTYLSKCDKGIQADSIFAEGMSEFDDENYHGAQTLFEKARILYDEIGSHEAVEAESMILKCKNELEKMSVTTPPPQSSRRAVGISPFPLIVTFFLCISLREKMGKG